MSDIAIVMIVFIVCMTILIIFAGKDEYKLAIGLSNMMNSAMLDCVTHKLLHKSRCMILRIID